MKKNKSRPISKTPNKVKVIDAEGIPIRESGIGGIKQNANHTIEAAYSELKNEYKKTTYVKGAH